MEKYSQLVNYLPAGLKVSIDVFDMLIDCKTYLGVIKEINILTVIGSTLIMEVVLMHRVVYTVYGQCFPKGTVTIG